MTASDEISLELQYEGQFEEQVKEGESDPYTGIKIRVHDLYVYGSSDRWPKNWVVYLLNAYLESLPAIMKDESEVVTNHNGPSYFVFEPVSETSVKLTHVLTYEGIDDTDKRLSNTESVVVHKRALIKELIDTGEELHDNILEINPSLEDRENISMLRSNIEGAREILSKVD